MHYIAFIVSLVLLVIFSVLARYCYCRYWDKSMSDPFEAGYFGLFIGCTAISVVSAVAILVSSILIFMQWVGAALA